MASGAPANATPAPAADDGQQLAPAAVAKYVEMILFLHGNLDLIPEDIPELDDKESHLPGRLDNPNPELEGLSGTFSPVDLTEEENEEDEEVEG